MKRRPEILRGREMVAQPRQPGVDALLGFARQAHTVPPGEFEEAQDELGVDLRAPGFPAQLGGEPAPVDGAT